MQSGVGLKILLLLLPVLFLCGCTHVEKKTTLSTEELLKLRLEELMEMPVEEPTHSR